MNHEFDRSEIELKDSELELMRKCLLYMASAFIFFAGMVCGFYLAFMRCG